MKAHRCGVADIISTGSADESTKDSHKTMKFHFISDYAFFSMESTDGAAVSPFQFQEAPRGTRADIVIGFYSYDHGDDQPFDGPRNILAHAFPPKDGRFIIDVDENWSTSKVIILERTYQVDLESVDVHEISHLLELAHRQNPNAIMHQDIHKLKKYLEKFGYLSYSKNKTHAHDDDFDELLESALKTFQLNFHLNSTGTLDAKTVSKMMMPRCGVADIINGTSWMRSGKKKHHPGGSKSIHEVSHFSFFPRSPRWPASQSHLTYAFLPGTRADAISPVANAFQTWAANTHFRFSRIENYRDADITISFERHDHRDGSPFDGPGGTLAHAFAPTDGRFHYDADETWSLG
ncbi:hypothetical protein CRYUN_Cryun15aG0026000 [Craigia yunnanensis]